MADDYPIRIADELDECGRVQVLERLAQQGAADPRVVRFAARATAYASDEEGRARALLAGVQAVRYVPEPEGVEIFQPAAWTLAHGGDCDDLAVLLVAACRAAGLRAVPAWITQTGAPLNHVTVLVWLRGAWQWAEPAVRGAALGESPWEATLRTGDAKAGANHAG